MSLPFVSCSRLGTLAEVDSACDSGAGKVASRVASSTFRTGSIGATGGTVTSLTTGLDGLRRFDVGLQRAFCRL